MKIKKCFLVIFVTLFYIFFPLALSAKINIETPAWLKVEALGKKGSYTFLLFGNTGTEEGKKMQTTVEEVKQGLVENKAGIVTVISDDPKEQELVNLFKIKEFPVVLAIAPNGAVTGYFSKTVDKNALIESLITLKETDIIKSLQEGQVVFLCFHKDTDPNTLAIKSNLNSVASNFKGAVDVIYASSDDKEEEKLREKFQISSETATAFIIVPPGRAVAKLEGQDITKANLMRILYASCGGGSCSPSGCR